MRPYTVMYRFRGNVFSNVWDAESLEDAILDVKYQLEDCKEGYEVLEDETRALYENSHGWVKLRRKQVPDLDGFLTDYTLYKNEETGVYVCMFGDNELYEPNLEDADFSTESEEEALEWFEDYSGYKE